MTGAEIPRFLAQYGDALRRGDPAAIAPCWTVPAAFDAAGHAQVSANAHSHYRLQQGNDGQWRIRVALTRTG
jgi:hypothetical protein